MDYFWRNTVVPIFKISMTVIGILVVGGLGLAFIIWAWSVMLTAI